MGRDRAALSEESATKVLLDVAEWLFLAGVALLPVMQFAAVDAFGVVVIPADALFCLAGALLLLVEITRRLAGVRHAFPIAAAVYLGAVVLAAVVSATPRRSFERVAIDAYVVGLGAMSFLFARRTAFRLRFAGAWLVGTMLTVGAGLLGLALFWAGRRDPSENFAIGSLGSVPSGSDPRLIGLFLNPNMFCNFLIVGMLFAAAVVGWRRAAGVVLLISICVVIALTYSPGLGGASLAVAIWLAVAQRDRWSARTRHVVLVLGVLGAVTFLGLAATLGPRAETWSDALRTFWNHPLLGTGPGAPVASATYEGGSFTDAHNAWLNIAGQAGLIGVLAFLVVVGSVCVLAWHARPLGDLPEPTRAAWCAFVGVVLYQGLSMSLEQTRHVWVLLGFLAAGLSSSARHGTLRRDAVPRGFTADTP